MITLREWAVRLWGTLRPSRQDADLEEELRLHVELAAEREQPYAGSPDEAGRAAAIASGGLAQAVERLRDQRALPWLDGLRRDLRDAVRASVRNAGFTLVTTVTLGVALGLCLTVVTIVNAYLIRPLPYPAADRLYSVVLATPGMDLSHRLALIDWAVLDDLVEHRIAWDLDVFYLLGGAYPEPAPGAWVTPGFLPALGLRAEQGRVLEPADFAPGVPTAVMISARLWASRFGSDPNVVGRTLKAYVSDRPDEPETLTVVGILPADFWHVNSYTDVLGPLRAPSYPYLVRLRDGVDPRAAGDRVTALVRAFDQTLAEHWRATLVPLQARYAEEMRPVLRAVATAAGLVLAIACANIAVLLLVRSARRRHEIAIRLALGTTRVGLARLLGFEALLVGGTATALGLGVSTLLVHGLAPVIEQRLGRRLPGGESALTLDGTLIIAAVAGGICLTLVLTLAPLVTLWSTAINPALESGGRSATESRTAHRLRAVLVAWEIAAALALLVGSALMIQSSVRMLRVDPGFRAAGVLTTSVGLRLRSYPTAIARADFYSRLLRRLDEGGGGSVALSDAWPLQPVRPTRVQSAGEHGTAAEAGLMRVSARYFDTLGIQFRDGGPFVAQDRVGAEPVVVVSESLARRLWPGTRAVGQPLRLPDAPEANAAHGTSYVVVGVVQDVRQESYDDGRVHVDANQLDAYLPLLQDPGRFAFLYTRNSTSTPDTLRSAIAKLDAEAAVGPPRSLASELQETRSGLGQLAWVLSSFAAVASLLALLGVYSVTAYSVRQREREIGLRVAVGADHRAVTRLFLREGSPFVACGLAAGIFGAAVLGQVLRSQLFGVEPMQPGVLATTTAAFAVCGWLALWWPARRAALVDPVEVLKNE